MALERVRLLVHACEALPAPSPDALTQLAGCLLQLGDKGRAGAGERL